MTLSRRNFLWIRCSLLELKRLNADLMKQNQDKDQEIFQLKSVIEESLPNTKLAAAYERILVLENYIANVRN